MDAEIIKEAMKGLPRKRKTKQTVAITLQIPTINKAKMHAIRKQMNFSNYVEQALFWQLRHDDEELRIKTKDQLFEEAKREIFQALALNEDAFKKTMEIVKTKWVDDGK